jgi:hypothetical protein
MKCIVVEYMVWRHALHKSAARQFMCRNVVSAEPLWHYHHTLEVLWDLTHHGSGRTPSLADADLSAVADSAMQSRSNRNLLFGGRAAQPTGDATTELVEAENQRGVDRLGGSACSMKDIAIAIEADVTAQNAMLDRVDGRFDHSAGVVASTLNALNGLVEEGRNSATMAKLIAALFAVMLLLYLVFRGSV